jgi:hypothetical protein
MYRYITGAEAPEDPEESAPPKVMDASDEIDVEKVEVDSGESEVQA